MGWTYNTKNPDAETNAPMLAAVGISFTSVSFILLVLRLYVRSFVVKSLGADDWTILPTWFMSLGFCVVTILQSKWGLGLQHLSDMPNENIFNFGLLQYCGAPFYITSILGFKISLLLSFLRIAIGRTYRYTIIGIIASCTAFHLCFLLVQINLCQPISKQWDPAVKGGNCLVAVPFYTSMASLTILFDVIIIITPFPMLLKLQIPKRKKVILLFIFSLGIFITVIQIIRIQTIKSLANYLDSSELIMWSMVENNLGIIVACIPTLAPLVKAFRDQTTNRSTGNVSSGGGLKKRSMGSGYVLQSIGGSKVTKGFVDLDKGQDQRGKRMEDGVIGLGDMEGSEEELNNPRNNKGMIYKTTEIVVDREHHGDDSRVRGLNYNPS